MTTVMPFFWLAALALSVALKLNGGRFSVCIAWSSAAGLLSAAAPVPARLQLIVFIAVLIIATVVMAFRKLFIKNS